MARQTNTKFYIVLGRSEDGAPFAASRNMSYNHPFTNGTLFAKREAAENEARYYANADVYSLQGIAYDLKSRKDHRDAKALALKTFMGA